MKKRILLKQGFISGLKGLSTYLLFLSIIFALILLIFTAGCTIEMADKPGDTSSSASEKEANPPAEEESAEAQNGEIMSDDTIDAIIEDGDYYIEDISECDPPRKAINYTCCMDDNNNSICDRYEVEETCGDNMCDTKEDECSCPQDCGKCEEKNFGYCKYGICESTGNESIDGTELTRCVAKQKAVCCGDSSCTDTESCSSCFQDCCTIKNFKNPDKLNLANYPSIAEGLSIVVGDKAPPEDVVVSEEIMTKIASENLSVGNGMLSSEITLGQKDYLVVGNPCDNPAAADLFRKEIVKNNDSCQVFTPTQGMIRIFMTSEKNIAIYIGGYSDFETEKASKFLIDYKTAKPTGMIKKI